MSVGNLIERPLCNHGPLNRSEVTGLCTVCVPHPGTQEPDHASIYGALQRIEAKLDALIVAHNDTVEKVNTITESIAPHLAEIGPMIDAIADNPMFRMLTGGKKRDRAEVKDK